MRAKNDEAENNRHMEKCFFHGRVFNLLGRNLIVVHIDDPGFACCTYYGSGNLLVVVQDFFHRMPVLILVEWRHQNKYQVKP